MTRARFFPTVALLGLVVQAALPAGATAASENFSLRLAVRPVAEIRNLPGGTDARSRSLLGQSGKQVLHASLHQFGRPGDTPPLIGIASASLLLREGRSAGIRLTTRCLREPSGGRNPIVICGYLADSGQSLDDVSGGEAVMQVVFQ